MPITALAHFKDDVLRARAVLAHAANLATPDEVAVSLRDDLLRLAWMMSVGALDAYFCDAYTDLVAATVISKRNQPAMTLPAWVDNIRFPLRAILQQYPKKKNWSLRMAARRMTERDDMLRLDLIRERFNPFFREKAAAKWWIEVMPAWIAHPAARRRLFGITGAKFAGLAGTDRQEAVKIARTVFEDRFRAIIQRRHDCIHNCDRPRTRPQPIDAIEVGQVVDDVKFFVERADTHLAGEFRLFLLGCGCLPADVAKVRY